MCVQAWSKGWRQVAGTCLCGQRKPGRGPMGSCNPGPTFLTIPVVICKPLSHWHFRRSRRSLAFFVRQFHTFSGYHSKLPAAAPRAFLWAQFCCSSELLALRLRSVWRTDERTDGRGRGYEILQTLRRKCKFHLCEF